MTAFSVVRGRNAAGLNTGILKRESIISFHTTEYGAQRYSLYSLYAEIGTYGGWCMD